MNVMKKISEKVSLNELSLEKIDVDLITHYGSLSGCPDADLCIRTGGERRLSNFLLWQFAYTELYFTDCFWPDFDESELQLALDDYAGRQRRYGGHNKTFRVDS